jgi:hypothetical protein
MPGYTQWFMKIGRRTRRSRYGFVLTAQNITPLERKQVPGIVGQTDIKDGTARVGV